AFYFVSPYMERGNLNHAIEVDNNKIKAGIPPVLNISYRLRIMFQIASAIDFLHTPVPDIRGLILHMDIKSLNIVLDKYLNARLIDFGLAREMEHGHDHLETTSIQYPSTSGYGKETQQQILAKHDDYRCFGVVMRELLTGRKPSVEGVPEDKLMDQSVRMIMKNKLMDMWKNLKVEPPVTKPLVDLTEKCITDKLMKSETIVTELKNHLNNTNTKRWETICEVNDRSKKCHMCLEYKGVEEPVLIHSGCEHPMNVCVSCMRNSYCNPVVCHSCDTVLTPTIGHGWAALLIAGNDRRDTVAKSFKEDVKDIHKVIISKCPLVMGVRADHVQTVHPEIPGQQDNILDKIQKSVTNLTSIDGIHTLLVYLSGHYKPLKGGFELSHCNSVEGKLQKETKFQYLSLKGLQDIIVTILNGSASVREGHTASKRAIVFLDCCSAPTITTPSMENVHPSDSEQQSSANLSQAASGDTKSQEKCSWIKQLSAFKLDSNISIVAINACRSGQNSIQEEGGSVFRRFLIQGLTRVALGGICEIHQCDHCHISGDFLTVGNLHTYISDHLTKFRKMYPSDPVMNVYNASGLDAKIGYVINFKADLQFTYKFKEKVYSDTIPQRMFSKLSELQSLLFDRYVGLY
ncbi:uncharacterized protein LOC128552417, partial [Mercenaria mercenaria]|uniref:uncharacterized protein LOC128552417 n=1 Tax=Mercenaria mercenaria TaxID=6596 RepID=UPI00234EB41B